MPLHPAPTIDDGLGLVVQQFELVDLSRLAEITISLNVGPGPSLSTAQDAIDDFQANFNANVGPEYGSAVGILPPTIRVGTGTSTPLEAVAAGPAHSSATGVTLTAPNVALLVKKTTGFGGKGNRGRTYYPFFLQSTYVAENGDVNPSAVASFQTAFNTFLAQLATDSTPMCICHKVLSSPTKPNYVTRFELGPNVTSYTVEPVIATQRRRVGR